MKNFKNYIFDLGGVIADINMQGALDGFRALGVPEEELRYDEGPTAKIMQNYQLGLLTTEEFCDAIIGRCKAGAVNPTRLSNDAAKQTPTRPQVADAWNTIIVGIPQQKIDALRTLKKRANVYLLSNTTELHWQKCLDLWFNANGNKAQDCFHHIFLSQEMHLEKPNPEIFKQVIRYIAALQTRAASTPTKVSRSAVNPMNVSHGAVNPTSDTHDLTTPIIDASNTVFLDDNLANVQSAMNCGISGIHVTPDYDWVTNLI